MQGAAKVAADLGRKWSRGASVLIVTAFAVGLFAVVSFLVVTVGGSLLQTSDGPDGLLLAQRIEWWKLSAALWGPLAVGWALPQIDGMIAEWKSDDEELRLIQRTERRGTITRQSPVRRVGQHVSLIAALLWYPALIIFGITRGWGWGPWMAAFGGGSLVPFALIVFALGDKAGPVAGRPAISGDEIGRPE